MKKQITLLLLLVTGVTMNAQTTYTQDSGSTGLAIMPAESYTSNTPGGTSGSHAATPVTDWDLSTTHADYLGAGFMKGDNDGVYNSSNPIDNGPVLTYNVNFVKTGVHYIWVRMYAVDDQNDSFWLYYNNTKIGNNIAMSTYGAWTWKKHSATFEVAEAGANDIKIVIRERQVAVDHIIVTSDDAFDPTIDTSWNTSLSLSDDVLLDNVISLSPNSTNNVTKLNIGGGNESTTISLYNINGQKLFSNTLIAGNNSIIPIDLINFVKGVYILKVQKGTVSKAFKIAKQ
ncbi:T9SS type A sorting domain-containing protein [Wenyingzhuangia sp. IMCC45467]